MSSEFSETGQETIDHPATENAKDLVEALLEDREVNPVVLSFLKKLINAPDIDARLQLVPPTINSAELKGDDRIAWGMINAIEDNKQIDPDVITDLQYMLGPVETIPQDEKPVYVVTEESHEVDSGQRLRDLFPKQRAQILSHTEFHNGSTNGALKEFKEFLNKQEMEPGYSVGGLSREVYLSPAFPLDAENKYIGCLVFVENDAIAGQQAKSYTARAYYLSRSGGVLWRYMPEHDGNRFGKGYGDRGEELGVMSASGAKNSVVATAKLQAGLSALLTEGKSVRGFGGEANRQIFNSTARSQRELYPDQVATEYLKKRDIPNKLEGNFYHDKHFGKIPPKELEFINKSKDPDFNDVIDSWTAPYIDPLDPNQEVRDVEIEIITSGDRQERFMFVLDREAGKAWIPMVEANTDEITATGQQSEWIDGGDLLTPPVEYDVHLAPSAQKYAEYVGHRHYVDMWPKYVSKIKIIENYLAYKGVNSEPRVAETGDLELADNPEETAEQIKERIFQYADKLGPDFFSNSMLFHGFKGAINQGRFMGARSLLEEACNRPQIRDKKSYKAGNDRYDAVQLLEAAINKLERKKAGV